MKSVVGYLGAGLRGDIGDEHRGFGKGAKHPAAKDGVRVDVAIVDPEAELPRRSDGRRAEERSIGRIGQYGVDLRLGLRHGAALGLLLRAEIATFGLGECFRVAGL